MKITKITPVGRIPVYDLSIKDAKHYVLENGVITHNTGAYYSADNIWIVGRRQDKKGADIQGYHFVIKIEKSRFTREGSKIPISVSFDHGIMKWSGLLEVALESGHVCKVTTQSVARWDIDNNTQIGNSAKVQNTQNAEFWTPILEDPTFQSYIKDRYMIATRQMIENEKEENDD